MNRTPLLSCLLFTVIAPVVSMAQAGFHSAVVSEYEQASQAGGQTNSASNVPITIPTGTHVIMQLTSSLHTTSATKGSAVFLETIFPVIAGNHEVIPVHTRVLGEVIGNRRPGRVHGKAQLSFHFDQLILPDNRDFVIAGDLQTLPGSSEQRTTGKDHTLEPVDQIDSDVYTVAATTSVGAIVGSLSRLGGPQGALIGAGLGLAKVLFTRGDAISLPAGIQVEMVLQRPLTITPNTDLLSKNDSAKK